MTRPKKQTVDYFPHTCTHKKTMFILEQKYGNDGYAFWFKLLEMLGSTEGHCLYFKNGMDWEYLIAKTKLEKEKCTEMLDLLANLKAIDKKLWNENKVVWCDNFIENIKDAYRNRVEDIPDKPNFLHKKPISKEITDVRNPHTKLKDTRLKKNINTAPSSKELKAIGNIVFNFKTAKWENIKKEDIELWKEAYPACDIELGLKQMKVWLLNNPKKRKKNYRRFISNWLSRWQEKGGSEKSAKYEKDISKKYRTI